MRLKLRLILELELELKQMVVVLIASTNPCKIEAVQSAFQTVSFVFGSEEQVFQDDSFVFHFMSSNSGVSSQPFGDDETRQGELFVFLSYRRHQSG